MINLDEAHNNANSMESEKRECKFGLMFPTQQATSPISENATVRDSLVMSVILGVKSMCQQLQ